MTPILQPILVPIRRAASSVSLILSSILTEEGQPVLTEEGGLVQTE